MTSTMTNTKTSTNTTEKDVVEKYVQDALDMRKVRTIDALIGTVQKHCEDLLDFTAKTDKEKKAIHVVHAIVDASGKIYVRDADADTRGRLAWKDVVDHNHIFTAKKESIP